VKVAAWLRACIHVKHKRKTMPGQAGKHLKQASDRIAGSGNTQTWSTNQPAASKANKTATKIKPRFDSEPG